MSWESDILRRISALETARKMEMLSMVESAFIFKDEYDTVRMTVGRLPDGTYGIEQNNGVTGAGAFKMKIGHALDVGQPADYSMSGSWVVARLHGNPTTGYALIVSFIPMNPAIGLP